jgi:hypothetical protein
MAHNHCGYEANDVVFSSNKTWSFTMLVRPLDLGVKAQIRRLRFKEKISEKLPSGCIEWRGSYAPGKAYGQFWWGVDPEMGTKTTVSAHRASWQLFRGPIPAGLQVLHKCNNPACVNSDDEGHLYLGDHAQNMKDREESGRTSKWDKRYNFIRSETLLDDIKAARKGGLKMIEICEALGIGRTTFYRCCAQDAELKTLMQDTKRDFYMAAGKVRRKSG